MNNQKQTELNDIEAALRSAGAQVDNGASEDSVVLPSLDKTAEPETTAKSEVPQEGDPKKETPETQKVTSDKSETKSPEKDAPQEDPKETKFVKAKKDAERRDRSWKALEEEKAQTRKREEELIAREKALQEKEEKLTQKPSEDRSKVLAEIAERYEKAAKDFEAEGKKEMAEACREKAKAILEVVENGKKDAAESKKKEFAKKWDDNLAEEVKANPDLNDAKSPLYEGVRKILDQKPVLNTYPEGIKDAVAIAKLRIEHAKLSGLVPGLQKELTEAKAKITELEKAVQIPGAGGTQRGSPKSFTDMSVDEQGQFLRQEAMALDDGG